MLPDQHQMTLATPRLPMWVVNLTLTLMLIGMWPLGSLLEDQLDPYFLRIVVLIGLNIILATSLNLINGITGQFSLGHAGFMAIGAYTAGSLMKHFDPTGWTSNLVLLGLFCLGGLLAALAGLIVGVPTLRLRGDYLAIATLGFGVIISTVIDTTQNIGPLEIGRSAGLHNIPIQPPHIYFSWTWCGVIICITCIWRLAYSTKGIAFRAVREDEIAAGAMGIDTTYYKVAAFIIGAFFAGIAGGLMSTYDGNLDPASFSFMYSIEIVVMVVLGGSGSITGTVLVAALLTCLPELLRRFQDWRMICYSLVLILAMLLRPEGLLGSREIWWTRRRVIPAPAKGLGEGQADGTRTEAVDGRGE